MSLARTEAVFWGKFTEVSLWKFSSSQRLGKLKFLAGEEQWVGQVGERTNCEIGVSLQPYL